MSWSRGLLCWALLAVLMVLHGIVRELALAPHLPERTTHQIGSVTGAALVFLTAYVALPWIRAASSRERVELGAAWLMATIGFELVFGHWVAGHSWSALIADYDLYAGRLWVLVLFATAFSPWLAGRLRDRRAD